jgi:hypothetical protein
MASGGVNFWASSLRDKDLSCVKLIARLAQVRYAHTPSARRSPSHAGMNCGRRR